MKINLDKLVEVQENYEESDLAYAAIDRMLEIVLDRTGDSRCTGTPSDSNYLLCFSTLQSLGIIEN